MLQVHSKTHTPFIDFRTLKTRDIPHQHFAAEIHFEPPHEDTQRVWLTPADLAQARLAFHTDQPLSPAAQHILDYLKAHGPSPTKALTRSADTCTPEQVRSAVYRLVRIGIIERTNEGSKGTPAIYGLV
ncbi:MAG: hypothetical protein AMK69_19495 [Nitrospira bacterium SG8_3]|nr:MAG: hypothetical protein AMK69_19495 [Nitrospira bacterium SG8_3]